MGLIPFARAIYVKRPPDLRVFFCSTGVAFNHHAVTGLGTRAAGGFLAKLRGPPAPVSLNRLWLILIGNDLISG